MAQREGLDLDRSKLARWTIAGGKLFQPIWNCLQDSFYSYDIALADETGIQVLKELGRKPENKSHLWIRRGGSPDKPVVLVDYSPSRAIDVAYGLLEHFKGDLVVDGYAGCNEVMSKNQLLPVYCNDHARRKFVDVAASLTKDLCEDAKQEAQNWITSQKVEMYKSLYRVENKIRDMAPEKKFAERQRLAVPLWDCDDGRLPIFNIQVEHVAKANAIPRNYGKYCFIESVLSFFNTSLLQCGNRDGRRVVDFA